MFCGQKDFELEIILFWLFRFLIALKNTLNHKKKNVVYVTMSLRKNVSINLTLRLNFVQFNVILKADDPFLLLFIVENKIKGMNSLSIQLKYNTH